MNNETMANLLIVDDNGFRRVQTEVAAAARGHKTYSAGTTAEAEKLISIYVPDAVLAPDGLAKEVLAWMDRVDNSNLTKVIMVTPGELAAKNGRVIARSKDMRPVSMLEAAEAALSST